MLVSRREDARATPMFLSRWRGWSSCVLGAIFHEETLACRLRSSSRSSGFRFDDRSPAAPSVDGLWDAVVVAGGTEVPFRFEIATSGGEAQGFFFEGDRQIGSTSGTFADGALKLEYDFLNTTLELRLTGDDLVGTYRNNRAGSRPQDVRMRRFAPAAIADENTPALAGSWEMRRNADEVTRAARHAHLACVPASVRRRAVGHHSPRRRRRRHAGRALAERQAGAEPLRRGAAEPVRGDARRRRHARRHAERQRALPGRPQRRGARQGHSRTAGSVALHQRQGSEHAVSFRVSGSHRQGGVRHRRAAARAR